MPSNPSLLSSPKQRHGGGYEKIAADFLQQQGLSIIAQNWQQPNIGEIDLILLHPGPVWDTVVFAEVRKRKVSHYGDALMSITKAKQRKLIKTARFFLRQQPEYAQLECRFDVVAFNQLSGNQSAAFNCSSDLKTEHRLNKPSFQADRQDMAIVEPDWIEPQWVQGAFIANAW